MALYKSGIIIIITNMYNIIKSIQTRNMYLYNWSYFKAFGVVYCQLYDE